MRIKDSTGEAEITLKTLHDDEGVTSQEESPGKGMSGLMRAVQKKRGDQGEARGDQRPRECHSGLCRALHFNKLAKRIQPRIGAFVRLKIESSRICLGHACRLQSGS